MAASVVILTRFYKEIVLILLIKTALLGLILPASLLWANDIRVPPQLKKVVQAEDVSVHSEFKVSDEIRGLVLKKGIDFFVVYETQDGNVIQGSIIDPSGKNLTAEHMQSVVPQRDLKKAAAMVG
ncbi:MAG: hypothetical protein R3194_06845, partial [Limnobacter sp.]|nr:hypothetical protein [Limnobacter sp.]